MANVMDRKTNYLIGKWQKRINLVESAQGKPLTLEKRAALANALENTADRIRAVEATNPNSIGAYKRYALDIINAIVPNLIAFDCVAVQAMDNRVGMINFIDYRYSNDKGLTKAGDVFNSSLNMGPSDMYYSSDLVHDHIIATATAATTYASKLAWTPVILPTFVLKYVASGVTYEAAADATGAIVGTNITSGTVTADGRVNLTFSTAPDLGTDLVVDYRYDNESVRSDSIQLANSDGVYESLAAASNHPEVELKINNIPVTAKARTMRSYWAFDAQYELQKEYGQSIEELLATQVAGELAHEIDNELTTDLLKFANAAAPIVWSRAQAVGISLIDHYESFSVKLTEAKNAIFNATRKVRGNFMVCGLDVATVVESMRNFKPSGVQEVAGPHYIGDIDGLKCFVNPDYPAREAVVGYKGSSMLDAGAFYCPYMPVSSTDLIMDANFRGQRGWATMYGKAYINSQMYVKVVITD